MTDEEMDGLLVRAGQGDNDALHLLYTAWRSAVFYFALAITGNYHDAQDILQDTFIRLKHAGYHSENAKAYVFAIARNLALTCLRERKRVEPAAPVEKAVRRGAGMEETTELDEALSRLPPDERQIVLLHVLGGLKHRETAALLRIPLGTALWKYQRALAKLRRWLKERGLSDEQTGAASVHPKKSGTVHT
ncbi:RNA polymerase sigma factor [Ethanoligenens harbinense]|uniref:RNA polymerase, sigma-24 subunit, ECF subfamily n=1 Tax=Ethanoligenens harbinense (strain DSM 18485 / JCM 12961 / CGMCC 1.5033 / YUAN-3) TaxID=663278 RepID=E6U729_ETHHY|nr:RNA polymerase sigma factor [Ethanoligenens harbinense]ADU28099.1 RNA polymerase, sigma-24 subunit, ECF subfamily [Ethanoligenens harbinense YUAN-3]AVQ97108.1 RNA polymerase sigma factor [Ethanoligenens harbinense YUAN-3]AYF39770.1 RNA polymerase sigma factor [Ethanoligenens harbinense]AYF42602.1 RNA polymerase sigma factor [Ethanoligenens harbinense]QCN93351.1 RNA polymerase sigma factor [Ethanoligenens harbinense]